jgi:hypothetical protein
VKLQESNNLANSSDKSALLQTLKTTKIEARKLLSKDMLQNLKSDIAASEMKIKEEEEKWQKGLKDKLTEVNKKFSEKMKSCGYRGKTCHVCTSLFGPCSCKRHMSSSLFSHTFIFVFQAW